MASPINSEGIQAALANPNTPSDITRAFLEQSRDEGAVIGILFVACFVTVLVGLRCVARTIIVRRFGWDDILVLLSMLPYIAFVTLCVILIHLGSGRHFLYIRYVLDNETINKTEILDFAAHIIYTTALLICRLSGLAFYARIVEGNDGLTKAVRGAALFIVLAYLPQLFLIIFHCLPVTGLWPYSFQPELANYSCIQWGAVYVTNSAISITCDLILFTIPAFVIAKLRLSLEKKLKLSLVLMPGLLVIGISAARMYLVVVGQWEADESWSYDYLLAVEVSEIGSTIVALSVPALKPLFGNAFASLDRIRMSRNTHREEPKSGSDYGTARNGSNVVELGQVYRRARNHIFPARGTDNVAEKSRSDERGVAAAEQGAYVPERDVVREPSMGSDFSRQPIIESAAQYSVEPTDIVK